MEKDKQEEDSNEVQEKTYTIKKGGHVLRFKIPMPKVQKPTLTVNQSKKEGK